MWTPPPSPREKIRKAQWTAENTRRTQRVVDQLVQMEKGLALLNGSRQRDGVMQVLHDAANRFAELDKGVKVPE